MRIRCARCGVSFTPEQKNFILCGEGENGCYQEVGLYGDLESLRFWGIASRWVNGKWSEEELSALAESVVGQEILKDILRAMNPEMRLKLLQREVRELSKLSR